MLHEFAANMQLQIILTFFFAALGLCSKKTDLVSLEALIEAEVKLLDAKDFLELDLGLIFTENATYNPGNAPAVLGILEIEALLSAIFPLGILSENLILNATFALLPPFDKRGGALTATAEVFTKISFLGQAALIGEVYVILGKYTDTYKKTGESTPYGGWKINSRSFEPIVSLPEKFVVLRIQRRR